MRYGFVPFRRKNDSVTRYVRTFCGCTVLRYSPLEVQQFFFLTVVRTSRVPEGTCSQVACGYSLPVYTAHNPLCSRLPHHYVVVRAISLGELYLFMWTTGSLLSRRQDYAVQRVTQYCNLVIWLRTWRLLGISHTKGQSYA
jgi:hypothetical protein